MRDQIFYRRCLFAYFLGCHVAIRNRILLGSANHDRIPPRLLTMSHSALSLLALVFWLVNFSNDRVTWRHVDELTCACAWVVSRGQIWRLRRLNCVGDEFCNVFVGPMQATPCGVFIWQVRPSSRRRPIYSAHNKVERMSLWKVTTRFPVTRTLTFRYAIGSTGCVGADCALLMSRLAEFSLLIYLYAADRIVLLLFTTTTTLLLNRKLDPSKTFHASVARLSYYRLWYLDYYPRPCSSRHSQIT